MPRLVPSIFNHVSTPVKRKRINDLMPYHRRQEALSREEAVAVSLPEMGDHDYVTHNSYDAGTRRRHFNMRAKACVSWRKMKFNSIKSKVIVVEKSAAGVSWKIGEEIMEEVEEFKYLGVWVDRKLRGNVQLEKMAKRGRRVDRKSDMDEQSE